MSDYSEPPFMANGDWIDGAWLNQYLRDNFRALWKVQAAEDLIVGASPITTKRLAKGANWTSLSVDGSGALAWTTLADRLQNAAMVASQATDDLIVAASATSVKRVAKGSATLKFFGAGVFGQLAYFSVQEFLAFAPIVSSQQSGDIPVANSASSITRLAKGANNTVLGVDGSGALAYQTLAQLVTAAPTAIALPMCLTQRTGAKTIGDATHTNGGIQQTAFNTGGFVVANDEIEIPTGMGGLYLVMAHANWEVNENGIRQLSVAGQTVDTRWGQPGVACTGSGWACVSLAAGAKVTLSVWQNSGITLWLNQARIFLVRIAAN